MYLSFYTHAYIATYIYIYGTPHALPTLVLYGKYQIKPAFPAGPYSVSLKDYRNRTHISRERVCQLVQVLREVRILYLSKTTEIKLTFQENVSVNSFWFDVSTLSTATLCSSNQKPTFPRKTKKSKKQPSLKTLCPPTLKNLRF